MKMNEIARFWKKSVKVFFCIFMVFFIKGCNYKYSLSTNDYEMLLSAIWMATLTLACKALSDCAILTMDDEEEKAYIKEIKG